MKPFTELTYQGRIRRLRQLAHTALKAYDLADPRVSFLRQAGNTLFRVTESNPGPQVRPELYAPGQYLLRIHEPGYQTPTAIALELEWLHSMCRDSGLPVPEPVLTFDGRSFAQVTAPGIPGERICSIFRWVRGRELTREEIHPHHYEALGELIARLHQHAARWQPPAGLSKRKYDWDGLFRQQDEHGNPSSDAWSLLPPDYVEPYAMIARETAQTMEKWGESPDVYGLIHADIGMNANVLFWQGDVRIIDFDDSGYGYYVFDLSIVLEDSQDHQIKPEFRHALLDGYTRVRPLTDDQIGKIDLFLAAYAVFWSLYAADAVRVHPEDQVEVIERMARYFRLVEHYLVSH